MDGQNKRLGALKTAFACRRNCVITHFNWTSWFGEIPPSLTRVGGLKPLCLSFILLPARSHPTVTAPPPGCAPEDVWSVKAAPPHSVRIFKPGSKYETDQPGICREKVLTLHDAAWELISRVNASELSNRRHPRLQLQRCAWDG